MSSDKLTILVLNGPNLNLLGEREPEVYGRTTLKDIEGDLRVKFPELNFVFEQSNHEGQLIDWIHEARPWAAGMIINPGALTHYSYALRDAIASVNYPTIEVHISQVYKREEFRQKSVIAPVVSARLCGFGWRGYRLAVLGLLDMLSAD